MDFGGESYVGQLYYIKMDRNEIYEYINESIVYLNAEKQKDLGIIIYNFDIDNCITDSKDGMRINLKLLNDVQLNYIHKYIQSIVQGE